MTRADAAPPVVDLGSCDGEPIHIPGAILPHGVMLVLDCDSLTVEQVAGDCQGLLGRERVNLLGSSAAALWNEEQIARLREVCAQSPLTRPRHLLHPAMTIDPGRPIDASIHRVGEQLLVEVEAADCADPYALDPLTCVQEMLDGLGETASLHDLCQLATERVRKVAGYDRVMVYRFAMDGSGWVFAESRRDDLPPFLDLHYPASDIPMQARALYLQNWLRLICEVEYEPARLEPELNPATGAPLDMSHAVLRDVSPIHREYLRNMGVDASMSISIIREGQLWGLISCHHYSRRWLPRHLRAICELFGSMFSLQLEARERLERFESRGRSRAQLQTLMSDLAAVDDYATGLIDQSSRLLNYLDAGGLSLRHNEDGGVAVRVARSISSFGAAPSDAQIDALADWLGNRLPECGGVFVTDRLSELYPPAAAFSEIGSGLLAIGISRDPHDLILWFRPAVVQTVQWGGDPTKPIELGPNGARLTPRKSFDIWTETVRNRSTPWSEGEQDAATDLRTALLDVVLKRIDQAAQRREAEFTKQQMLMAELDHRVKNTLANIQALVTQTSTSSDSLESFAQGLNRRIQSMSRVHSLLSRNQWEGVALRSLLSQELDQFAGRGDPIRIDGDDCMLSAKAALAVSLAIHELATNAAKYGSLSVREGWVEISWRVSEGGGLALTWSEHNGPVVVAPAHRGFGTTLIGRAFELETGGSSQLDFAPEGLRCAISLPAATIMAHASLPVAVDAEPEPELPHPNSRRRILVVEDSSLVIMMIEDMLEHLGWEAVGPATRLAEALDLARSAAIDAALVDINLDGEMSWEVARILSERGKPFALTTGYDGATVLPDDLKTTTIIAKPFAAATVAQWLSRSLADS